MADSQPVLIPPQPVLIPTPTLSSCSNWNLYSSISFLLFSKSEPPLPATLMLCFGEESEADRTNMNAREGEHGGGDDGGDQLKKY
jgi:hypothetical protein